MLARIDEHRGEVSRSAWILAACEAALNGVLAGVPVRGAVTFSAERIAAAGRTESLIFNHRNVPVPAQICPHPKARVIKGMCGACGTGGLD